MFTTPEPGTIEDDHPKMIMPAKPCKICNHRQGTDIAVMTAKIRKTKTGRPFRSLSCLKFPLNANPRIPEITLSIVWM